MFVKWEKDRDKHICVSTQYIDVQITYLIMLYCKEKSW
jgi:hypothetical protein